jgi:hypothetical protein
MLLLIALLLLGGCVTYPGPYEYDDPYYQSSTAYNGPYDDQYYSAEDAVGYTGYVGAYDVTQRYDPWFRMYWGWDYYGYAPYRHNYYNSYYGYGYVPFYRPYHGYGWSAWDYLWWPSSGYYGYSGYGYTAWPWYGGWYGSGYYWHPRGHGRDDRDDHRSARQAAREIRPGVPATHSSRLDARGQSFGGQGYRSQRYDSQSYGSQRYGGQAYGNPSGRYAPRPSGGVRDAARSIAPQGDAGRSSRSYAAPVNQPSGGVRAPALPATRARSESDVPMSNYPANARGRSSSYEREARGSRSAAPDARGSTWRPEARPATSYRPPSRPASAAPASAPQLRSTPSASPRSTSSARSTAPSASGGSARAQARGRTEQED